MGIEKTGKAIIFSAPSGSGKTTIVKHLLNIDNRLAFSVSACTRPQREGEMHGKDYYFLQKEEFLSLIDEEGFLEYEEVYGGNYYGTLKSEISRIWSLKKAVVFDVDVEGGLNLKKYFGNNALAVFVKPPDLGELEQRLRNRSTETEATLKMRVEKAVNELTYEAQFEKILINDNLAHALMNAEMMVTEFLIKEN